MVDRGIKTRLCGCCEVLFYARMGAVPLHIGSMATGRAFDALFLNNSFSLSLLRTGLVRCDFTVR